MPRRTIDTVVILLETLKDMKRENIDADNKLHITEEDMIKLIRHRATRMPSGIKDYLSFMEDYGYFTRHEGNRSVLIVDLNKIYEARGVL